MLQRAYEMKHVEIYRFSFLSFNDEQKLLFYLFIKQTVFNAYKVYIAINKKNVMILICNGVYKNQCL